MKKAHYLVLLFLSLLLLFYPNVSYAEESIEEQTIQAQKESLGIGEFLKKAEEYKKLDRTVSILIANFERI